MRRSITFLIFASISLQVNADGSMETLSKWMQGAFTSEKQSQQDEDFFNIHLYMTQIWKDQADGQWLYVEQAAASRLEQPYRQRVYHLTKLADGRFKSEVFTFENSLDYAGDWKSENALADLNPDKLSVREGCAVFLSWDESINAYTGSTDSKKCKSNLSGATYATSIVTVFADRIESWDQGFNSNDEQVWGAVKSGYVFDSIE